MMTDMIATIRRLALVPALAMLIVAGAPQWALAGDAGAEETGVSEKAAAGEDFMPPLTGAPEKRMGAASRELGQPAVPCGDERVGTGAGAEAGAEAAGECADENAILPEAEGGESEGAAQ
jgi:hypothetical protein